MFNPLKHPVCLMLPDRLTSAGAWAGHIPFAFTLVDILRPKTFVELGVHTGVSYCAFIQAITVLDYPAKCVGVDTWKGDVQTGEYDEALFEDLSSYHNSRYSKISTLSRKTFKEALLEFPDNSIDLLHIDGCHFYGAVKEDFDSWLPKVKPEGVILMHDTSTFDSGYETFRFWREISPKYNHFEFTHSAGLGILSPIEGSHPLLREFFEATPQETFQIRNFFSLLGDRVRVHYFSLLK